VTPERLAETITIPWFKDPPMTVTVAQALTQAAMHSHYHRGRTRRGCVSWVVSRRSRI